MSDPRLDHFYDSHGTRRRKKEVEIPAGKQVQLLVFPRPITSSLLPVEGSEKKLLREEMSR